MQKEIRFGFNQQSYDLPTPVHGKMISAMAGNEQDTLELVQSSGGLAGTVSRFFKTLGNNRNIGIEDILKGDFIERAYAAQRDGDPYKSCYADDIEAIEGTGVIERESELDTKVLETEREIYQMTQKALKQIEKFDM